jgi:hypothetical protein
MALQHPRVDVGFEDRASAAAPKIVTGKLKNYNGSAGCRTPPLNRPARNVTGLFGVGGFVVLRNVLVRLN